MKSQNLDGEHVLVHNLNPEEVTGEDSSRQYRDIPNPFEIIDIQQSKLCAMVHTIIFQSL
jgi:hypothetical protein